MPERASGALRSGVAASETIAWDDRCADNDVLRFSIRTSILDRRAAPHRRLDQRDP